MSRIGFFHRLPEPDDIPKAAVKVFDDHIVVDGRRLTLEQIELVSVRARQVGSWKQTELVVDLVGGPRIVAPLPSDAAADAAALTQAVADRKLARPAVPPVPPAPLGGIPPRKSADRRRRTRYHEPLKIRLLASENTIFKILTGAAVLLLLVVVYASTHHANATDPVATRAPLPSPHAGTGPIPSASSHPQVVPPSVRPSRSHHASPQPTHHSRTRHPKPTAHPTHGTGRPTGGTTHAPTVAPPPPAPSPPAPSPHPTSHPAPPSPHPSPPAPHPSVSTHKPAPSPSVKTSTPPPKPSISTSAPAPSPSISLGVLGLVRHVLAMLAAAG